QVPVVALAEGRVEVDEVDPLGALLLPGLRGLQGVTKVPPGAGDALLQLHGPPPTHVDGGKQLQPRGLGRGHSDITQFFRRCSPASPDFSGWNCVADNGPFSTAATKGDPCSLHVTRGAAAASPPGATRRSQSATA